MEVKLDALPTHFDCEQFLSDLNSDPKLDVLEASKTSGDCYPPDTLYSICSGLQRRPEINICKSPTFAGFQKTLDGEMKRSRSTPWPW